MKDRFDEKLIALLQGVSVPEGLAQRLLERLNHENLGMQNENRILSYSSFFNPSRLLAGGGIFAIAAVLLMTFWLSAANTEISEQFVLNEAIRLYETIADQPDSQWSNTTASIDYPFSKAMRSMRGMRWRPVDDLLNGRGIAYRLPGPAGVSALLYVLDIKTDGTPQEKPSLTPFSTSGCCASAWQEDGMLYVLVVKGDVAMYRTYLNLPQGPVATLWPNRQSSLKPA